MGKINLTYAWTASGGLRAGAPQASAGVSFGGTIIARVSENQRALIGPSQFTTADISTPAVELGASGTWSRAYNYSDTNNNRQYDLAGEANISEPLAEPYIDPVYNRTVDALSFNMTIGGNMLPLLPVDVGLAHGIADTDGGTVNLYQPVMDWLIKPLQTLLP